MGLHQSLRSPLPADPAFLPDVPQDIGLVTNSIHNIWLSTLDTGLSALLFRIALRRLARLEVAGEIQGHRRAGVAPGGSVFDP